MDIIRVDKSKPTLVRFKLVDSIKEYKLINTLKNTLIVTCHTGSPGDHPWAMIWWAGDPRWLSTAAPAPLPGPQSGCQEPPLYGAGTQPSTLPPHSQPETRFFSCKKSSSNRSSNLWCMCGHQSWQLLLFQLFQFKYQCLGSTLVQSICTSVL